MLREIFLELFLTGLFRARVPNINAFSFSSYIVLLETNYSSEAFQENINISLLLTGSFPPKPLKTTAHGLPKISRNLSSNGPTFGKKYKKGFLFSNISIKQGKMDTETSKIALNAHVHLRTANQQMSRPERHVDDITDMRRSCQLRENTSGRRPLGSSSRLLKVPNDTQKTISQNLLIKICDIWQNFYFYRILNNENFKMEVEQTIFVTPVIITVQSYY